MKRNRFIAEKIYIFRCSNRLNCISQTNFISFCIFHFSHSRFVSVYFIPQQSFFSPWFSIWRWFFFLIFSFYGCCLPLCHVNFQNPNGVFYLEHKSAWNRWKWNAWNCVQRMKMNVRKEKTPKKSQRKGTKSASSKR